MKNWETYQKAKRMAKGMLRFEVHLFIFITVSILLLTINLITSPEHLWFKWPLVGWSMIIFWYAITVIVFKGRYIFWERPLKQERGSSYENEERI